MPTKTYSGEEDTHAEIIRREDRVALRTFAIVDAGEAAIHHWVMRYSIFALRISMGAVYLGFGILKYFPGVSPAESLVLAVTHVLSFGLVPAAVPNGVVMVLLATLECTIGLMLITGWWLRVAIYLLGGQLVGVLSPAVLLAGREFAGQHHMPTLESQYVLKDVILVAVAMVIATTVRGGTLTDGECPSPKNRQREALVAAGGADLSRLSRSLLGVRAYPPRELRTAANTQAF
jgi:putative oxidoreductase